MKIIVTTTWNSAHVIETFFAHYRKLGFDLIVLMDFNSSDATQEIIRSARYSGFAHLVPFPGIAGLDSSALMLELLKITFAPDTCCLFCDPDELLVIPPETQIANVITGLEGGIIVPRFNVTAPLSEVLSNPSNVHPLGSLTLRIDSRCTRDIPADIKRDFLNPPWIYTAIPGKVFVRLQDTVSIGDGDHTANLIDGSTMDTRPGTYLLHFPLSTYEEFERKINMNRIAFASNPHLPEWYGWQSRRWIRIADCGRLHEEFLQQFVPDNQVAELIESGTLTMDESIRSIHSETNKTRSSP